ncbi:SCO2400 family protein [Streptomyces sviceus]|uniref:SCO2400 family protein n=1 Tax=Streptomyces sviceus TaxID=285530 RepID=UPI0036DFE29A
MVQSTQEDQMDYCSSCRRHLNGALACPGCGAYAPDIAPPAHVYATTGTAAATWDEAPKWHDAGLPEEPAADPGVTLEDVADAPVVAEGRAARRRQRVRWKKNQRKAVVATAVALVGGGLTVSAMNQQSHTRTQASTSPDNRSMGVAELPTSDNGLPASTPATARQASTTTPSTKVGSHRRTVDSESTTTRSSAHTDSAASPTPTTKTASRAQSQGTLSTSVAAGADTGGTTGTTTTTSGTTGTTTTGQTSSSSTGTDSTTSTSTNTGSNTGSNSGSSQTSQTTTSSSASDPSGLCVLNLLCIS